MTRVKAIYDWSVPDNTTFTRVFYDIADFYRRFMHDFAKISAVVFFSFKSKNTHFDSTKEMDVTFNELKKKLTSTPMLALSRSDQLFMVDTDASSVKIGAVFSQEQNDEKLHETRFSTGPWTPSKRDTWFVKEKHWP